MREERDQIRWILDTLKVVLRLLDITNREIESKLGWSHGYLSRIFAGNIELRVEHVIEISHHAGLTPAEAFHLAYPALPEPLSPNAARLYQLLRRFQASGPPPWSQAIRPAVSAQEDAATLQPSP